MRCAFVLIFAILVFPGTLLAKISPELYVRLRHGGGLTGHFRTSHSGHGILAYSNVPYAEPPIGELRFKDPVPKRSWTGYLPSNRSDIQCAQQYLTSPVFGVEDCLYLNVYVPQDPEKEGNSLLPVMIFIHGGGFTAGTGSMTHYDPELMLDEDVILVTGNYRLGAFGFLADFQGELTGNWGLKDQQLMLRWVQENIHSFGGDPEKVTIFGVSAGGASVGLHLMAPESKGLFQRAIMQSGTPFDAWVIQDKERAIGIANKFKELVGCPGEGEELMKCLRALQLEDVMKTNLAFFEWNAEPLVPFGPVLEGDDSPHPFLTEEDTRTIDPEVPVIIGEAHDEGAFKSVIFNENKDLIADLDKNFTTIIPSLLCFSHYPEDVQRRMTQGIQEFYLQGREFNWNRDKHTMTEIVSDGLFLAGFDKFLGERLRSATAQTFVYLFNYRGGSSFTDIMANSDQETNWGVSHAEDMLYEFPLIKNMAPHRVMYQKDIEFGQKFVRSFARFAQNGDPTLSESYEMWRPATEDRRDYLRIGNCNRVTCPKGEEGLNAMESDMFKERLTFWRNLLNENGPNWAKRRTKRDEL